MTDYTKTTNFTAKDSLPSGNANKIVKGAEIDDEFDNIATAVAAIKSGAIDYLPKPAEIDQIYDALTNSKEILPPPPENPMTADRIRWEHIQRVFIQCNRNVSETARRLRMHRRTLQRILNKHAPRE